MILGKFSKIVFHAIGIVLFLTLPLLIAPRPEGVQLMNLTGPAIRDLISGVLMVSFFYGNYYLFVPFLFVRKKYVFYVLLLLISFAGIMILPSLFTGHIPWSSEPSLPALNNWQMGRPHNTSFILSISHNMLLFLSVITLSVFLRVQERLFQVEKAKNQMEILSLKDQINPHFLFNILNNIYGQAIEDQSTQTASSILKLSDMLRYVVHEAQSQWIPLSKELDYLENYIELQRQRLGDGTELNYLTKGSFSEDLKIAPLILIPFIENSFKHGISPDEKSQVNIQIAVNGNLLELYVRNRKANVRLDAHERSGAGTKISLNRLKLLYPDRFDLSVNDLSEEYIVNLKLELHA